MSAIPGISPEEHADRQQRVRDAARRNGWQGVVVVGRAFYDRCGSLAYLSGHYPPFPTTVFSGRWRGIGHSVLILPVDDAPTLLVDGEYREDRVAVLKVCRDRNLVGALAALLGACGPPDATWGLAGRDIVPEAFHRELQALCPQWKWADADDLLNRMRMRKSPAEQTLLRQAAKVASAGLGAALAAVQPGRTERQVCAAGVAAAIEAGADFVRYFRVHTGRWSARGSRWPPATDRKLQSGDTVYMDIIGAADGYQFDVLRTTAVGPPSREQRRLFEAVDRTLERLLHDLRPGLTAAQLSRLAADVLRQLGYVEGVSPFVGHGIGLETVEQPLLVPDDDTVLEPGMVLCVEPKISIRDRGGCSIEQEVVVQPGGVDLLTTLPTRLWSGDDLREHFP